MIGNNYAAAGMEICNSASSFWRELQIEDGHLPDLEQVGYGEVIGGHLRVRFAHDNQQCDLLACEVLNLQTGEIWEAAFARTSTDESHPVFTYWQRTAGTQVEPPKPWAVAVEGFQLIDRRPRLQPRFLSFLGALSTSGAFALTENVAAKAALDDELSYWRDLSRSQAKVIKRIPTDTARQWRQEPAGPIAAPTAISNSGDREWRLRDLDEWAAQNSERIVILPRALSAARKSEYADPAAVFAALEVLASTYPAVKMGLAHRNKIKDELTLLNMDIGGSVDPVRAGMAGSEYEIRWGGRKRFLDQHIKKGVSREPRFSLRIYFTWDEESERVIVGWLPGHLTCSKS